MPEAIRSLLAEELTPTAREQLRAKLELELARRAFVTACQTDDNVEQALAAADYLAAMEAVGDREPSDFLDGLLDAIAYLVEADATELEVLRVRRAFRQSRLGRRIWNRATLGEGSEGWRSRRRLAFSAAAKPTADELPLRDRDTCRAALVDRGPPNEKPRPDRPSEPC